MSSRPIAQPTADGVRQRLAEAGLDVPEDCIGGTVANLIVLQDHMETLRLLPLGYWQTMGLQIRA